MNNKEILSKNLKKQLNNKDLTPTEFARIMKYPETTVFNWIHGKSYPRIDKIQEMADFFDIYKSDLTEDKNNLSNIPGIKIIKKFVTVPMLGEIACGEPIFCNENYDSIFQIDEDLGRPDFCLTARGDSMIDAGIDDGDIVFFKNTAVVENGKIAAVIIDNTTTLKRFFKNDHEIILQPENKTYSPIIIREDDGQEVRVLGEMIGMYFKGSK